MDKRAVISVIALVAVGAGAGFLWRKQERARVEEPVQAAAVPAVPTNPEPAAAPASARQLAQQLGASLNGAGNARPAVPPAIASPADLQKRAEIRKKLEETYPDLAMALELTPEEAGQFFDLLARQQAEISALIAARPGSIRDGVYSDSLARDIRTMELADDAEQAAMLAGKYPQWLQQQETQLQQNTVDQLQGALLHKSIHLSDEEIEPLAKALAAEQKRLTRDVPGAGEPEGNSRQQLLQQEVRNASNSRQLARVASRYLNSQQLEAYEQLLQERAQTAQRLLRVMEDENGE